MWGVRGGAFGRSLGRKMGPPDGIGETRGSGPLSPPREDTGRRQPQAPQRGSQQHRRCRHLDGGRAAPRHWVSGCAHRPWVLSQPPGLPGCTDGLAPPARTAQERRQRARAVPEPPHGRPLAQGRVPEVPLLPGQAGRGPHGPWLGTAGSRDSERAERSGLARRGATFFWVPCPLAPPVSHSVAAAASGPLG